MKVLKSLIAVVVGILVFTACAPAPTPATPVAPITNTAWVLDTLNGKQPLADTAITLFFETEKMGGSDGCNRYDGSFEVNGDKLTFGKDIVKTLMGCADPILKQGDEFTTALAQTAAYRSDGQTLSLLDGSGKTLAAFTVQSTQLGGTSWVATSYNNGKQAVVNVLAGSQLTVEFGEDGKLSGSAGCNNFIGDYQVTGNKLNIGALGLTRMSCGEPAGLMEQEALFVAALQGDTTFRMEGNTLELRNADGALMVNLQKAP